MTEPEQDPPEDDPHELRILCNTCRGDGFIPDPKAAVIGGTALTLNPGRPCPACSPDGKEQGHGRTIGFYPPA
ncbi:hypothetical protein [Amycolatopsis cihanbeyliensis]|uniref:Uncharacterized protein n=1 Tax=Amycolatopsis cihanbeyliensis TaxID=1128664 RepID=A0A542CUY8_AMYCI|nr:hypothetical protein [Amycolatopsis cihanbeyliensis]TQI94626.1 hypothetical protein FB471_6795 [Amycolatopsis cihanbeyliensis]